jgi:hypothetical protein
MRPSAASAKSFVPEARIRLETGAIASNSAVEAGSAGSERAYGSRR